MDRKRGEQFNSEVDGYRSSLLYYAKMSNWEEFKIKAGRLFDYVETVESSELERRFFSIFNPVLVVLGAALLVLLGINFEIHPEWIGLKNAFILAMICASSFEIYFFLGYRLYVDRRTRHHEKRREMFIRSLEQDFRGYTRTLERCAA